MCAVGVSLDVIRGAEGMKWVGMGEEEGEMVWDEEEGEMVGNEETVDEDDQEVYHPTMVTAKSSDARRLLQMKMHQSCLKSG